MKIKVHSKTIRDGITIATFLGIEHDNDAHVGEFDLGNGITAKKEWPEEIVVGETFHHDLEKIEGRPLTAQELGGEYDPEKAKGRKVIVVTGSKKGSGGRNVKVVVAILDKADITRFASEVLPKMEQQ